MEQDVRIAEQVEEIRNLRQQLHLGGNGENRGGGENPSGSETAKKTHRSTHLAQSAKKHTSRNVEQEIPTFVTAVERRDTM